MGIEMADYNEVFGHKGKTYNPSKDIVIVGNEAGQVLIAAINSPDSIFPTFSYGQETYSDLAKLREAGIFRDTSFGLALSDRAKSSKTRFAFDEGMLRAGASVPVTVSIAGRTVVVSDAARASAPSP